MFECQEIEEFGLKWLCLEGRIDAMTAMDIEKALDNLMLEGERVLGVDFEKVNYISSAGLRIFIRVQKQLGKVGGDIVLAAVPSGILEIFRMTGFDKLFRMAGTREEIGSIIVGYTEDSETVSIEIGGLHVTYLTKGGIKGSLRVFGDQKKLDDASYEEEDVVRVRSRDFVFGAGLGTLGDHYDHYGELFGEAMVINRNFFFYPAVKNPAVDFLLCTGEPSHMEYNFLHGFGFDGAFRYIVSFDGKEESVELAHLVDAVFQVSPSDLLGMVILGESKGVWGMHLKKVPIRENRPENGKSIFDRENFSDWFNFPVEPTDINHVIACTGIAVRDRNMASTEVKQLIGESGNFHFHGGIFSRAPLSKKIGQFEKELQRVLTELDISKVQHLLGKSRFGSGMAGIIELEG